MITTVTLNPCIDKVVTVKEFKYGGLNRIKESKIYPAGKGINVGVAFKQLGGEVICLGINYQENGEIITNYLEQRAVNHDFVMVGGAVRTNLKVIELKENVMTEINESGYPVNNQQLQKLKNKLFTYASHGKIMVFSGSVPRGVGSNIYRDLITEVKRNNPALKIILDTEGELLLEGIKAKPWLIKPNKYELEMTFNKKVTTKNDMVAVARQIIKQGVEIVCVSLGAEGALIVNYEEAYWSPGLSLEVKGTPGAGDSLVAGICRATEQNLSLAEMLIRSVAAASASVIRPGTRLCQRKDYQKFLLAIKLEKII